MITRPIVYKQANYREEKLMNNSKYISDLLDTAINHVINNKNDYLEDSNAFTRSRKFDLNTLLKFIIFMGGGVIKDEIYDYFGLKTNIPTTSAFVQCRKKLNYKAFEHIFTDMVKLYEANQLNLYKGYRLLAIDGSMTLISKDKYDRETYHKQISRNKDNSNWYNGYHINAMYDLMSHLYTDIIIQGENHCEEVKSSIEMVDRYNGPSAIFIADRNYGAYNLFEHIKYTNNKYLIRVKDITSGTSLAKSLCSNLDLNDEFDVDIERTLTRRATNEIKAHPEIYKFLPQNANFDYLSKEKPYYDFKCRIVRFKIANDSYECIITNLDRDDFPPEEIKELYNMRWTIETSFRELKYAVDLSAYHAKNRNSIKQEIYARIIFSNLSEMIIQNVKPKKSIRNRIHEYKINATRAFHTIRKFFKTKGDLSSPVLESIISNNIEPIRLNRSDPRKVRAQTAIFFIYRF